MDEKDISLFDTVISDLVVLRTKCDENFMHNNEIFIDQFKSNRTNKIQDYKYHITTLLNDFLDFQKYSEQQNKVSSFDLNIFRMFGVGETMHSYILANFLNPSSEHGQKHLFLNVFLDMLKIKRDSDSENWIVTAEKGRIDVLLKRVQPHSVVVIENKSNYATDQENQLYRYWHKEIYKTICNKHLPKEYIQKPPDYFYQLIYLSPAKWKIPSNNSLMKPLGWTEDLDLPDTVPLQTKHLLFNEFIVQWLNDSLKLVPIENHRIREYIKQYIELWT